MKLFKDKERKLDSVNEQFLDQTLKSAESLNVFFGSYVKGKTNEDELEEVIKSESECDRLKEDYIKVLYSEKRALPFLVEDRYKIVNLIDTVNDKIEFIARFLGTNPFDIYEDTAEPFGQLNDLALESVKELIDCAILLDTSFDQAYEKTFKIEEIKRTARKLKFSLIEQLFKKADNDLKVYIASKLVTYLYEIVSFVEEISDFLRGLIIKYPRR